ncbi:MAG: hypothetical protein ACR2QU_02635 [Gammaproteobacteria bacterium]
MDKLRAFNRRLSHTRDLIHVVDPSPGEKKHNGGQAAMPVRASNTRRR